MRKPRRSRFSQPRPRTMASYKEQNHERLVRLLDQAADAREPVHRAGSSLRSGMAARRWRISSLAAGPACTVHCSSGTVRPSARAAMNERTGRPLVRSTSTHALPFLCVVAIAPGDESHEHDAKILALGRGHVLIAQRALAVGLAFEQARLHQRVQAPGEHVRRDIQAAGKFVEAAQACSASRMIRMLHHSPTRSRLRAMGHSASAKVLRCMVLPWRGSQSAGPHVTFMMIVTSTDCYSNGTEGLGPS